MTVYTDISGPQKINPDNTDDPLTSPVASQQINYFQFFGLWPNIWEINNDVPTFCVSDCVSRQLENKRETKMVSTW